VFTTLFPHLGHHKIHEFRWAFIAGLAGILVLYVAGLISAAILVSAFLVPVLYLIYLYEAQVYRDEPAIVLGFTLGGGIIVGIVVTVFERIIYNPFQYSGNPFGNASVSLGGLLIVGLVLPVVQEALSRCPRSSYRTAPIFQKPWTASCSESRPAWASASRRPSSGSAAC
jgi:hypothetical protein